MPRQLQQRAAARNSLGARCVLAGMRWTLACLLLLFGCERERQATRDRPLESAPTPSKTFVQRPEPPEPAPPPSASASVADAAPPADPPPPKLVPFLTLLAPVLPAPAPVKGWPQKAPAGFDVRKDGKVFHLADGELYAKAFQTGPSNVEWVLSLVRGGVEVRAFPQVRAFSVDVVHDRLVLEETRPGPAGPLRHREIVDLATGTRFALPTVPCTDHLVWVDEGRRLLGDGFVHDIAVEPDISQVSVCLFDASGVLQAKLDGGKHPHHAAAENYVNAAVGVLPKDPSVVYVTREYRPHGNSDVTFLDTNPPHARKIARLNTPARPFEVEGPSGLQLDLAATTLTTATEVRFRARHAVGGWWWQWQTTKLVDAP